MNWLTVFSLYIFRFIKNTVIVRITSELIRFPFNSIISTKINSMFTTLSETTSKTTEGVTEIKYLTYLGESKITSETPLVNDTFTQVTTHSIKFLELTISIQGKYINYNKADLIFTDVGECYYDFFINGNYFKVTLLNGPYGMITTKEDHAFIFGQNLTLYASPEKLNKSFKMRLLYTNQEESQGISVKVRRPTENSLGKSLIWQEETQTLISAKYWDINEGKTIETSFDVIYFDNL